MSRRRRVRPRRVLPSEGQVFRARQATDDMIWEELASWVEAREWMGFTLPLSLFSLIGVGMWFADESTAHTKAAIQISAWGSINASPGNVFFSSEKGLAVYDPQPTGTVETKVRRYFKL
jgi:hypothetical protein